MVRKSVRVSGRLVMSAAISWTLIPIANADAPTPSDSPQPEVTNVTANAAPESGGKQLFTVPEDGMGDTKWLSGATRIVREITMKRPKEDLVICIAGCVGKQDRVVYAQPTEYVPPKTGETADGASGAPKIAPAKAEAAKPAAPKPATAAVTPPVTPPVTQQVAPAASPAAAVSDSVKIPAPMNAAKSPAPSESQPAIAPAAAATAPVEANPGDMKTGDAKAGDTKADDTKRIEFVPTMSKPEGETAVEAPKAEQPK